MEIRKTRKFENWFSQLTDKRAKARILARIDRLVCGHYGDAKPVGQGVSEMRIFYGPGYRIYFTHRGPTVVILLTGGTKQTQQKDITEAKLLLKVII